MNKTVDLLLQSAQALQSVCDGAIAPDRHGFNAFDAPFGRTLAYTPAELWTPKLTQAGYKLLRKYQKQIADLTGIVYADIPAPIVDDKTFSMVGFKGGKVFVKFPPNSETNERVKAIFAHERCARFFDWDDTKAWFITPDARLSAYLKNNPQEMHWLSENFDVSELAVEALLKSSNGVDKSAQPASKVQNVRTAIVVNDVALCLKFEYNPGIVEIVKKFPSANGFKKWDDATKSWTVGINTVDDASSMMRFLVDKGFDCAPVLPWLRGIMERLNANREMSAAEAGEPMDLPELKRTPFPFQWVGIRQVVDHQRVLIADEMGLGKSIQSIVGVYATGEFPCLVVVPASLRINWKREIQSTLPDRIRVCTLIAGMIVPKADFYIANYEQLSMGIETEKHGGKSVSRVKLSPLALTLKQMGLRSMILDEAHFIKSPKSQRTLACLELGKGLPVKVLLTGTPVMNRPIELTPLLDFIDQLQPLGGWWKFVHQYCGAHEKSIGRKSVLDTGGATNLGELNARLRQSGSYIRRLKSDVLKDLPPLMWSPQTIELSNRAEYDRAESNLMEYLGELAEDDKAFKKSIAHLPKGEREQAVREYRASAERKAKRAEALVLMNTLRQLVGVGKVKGIVAWVKDFLEGDDKLVIFAHHVKVISALVRAFGCPFIDGSVSLANRQGAVDRFQDDPDCRLIVVGLMAGGVGLTLTAASNVFIAELPWRPGDVDQAAARIHRIGQTADSCTCWFGLADCDMENKMYAMLARKRAVTGEVTDGEMENEFVDLLVEGTGQDGG